MPPSESAYFLAANRNKRSLAVDIATAEGADTVRELVTHCDLVVENFKVGGLRKYGLDYDRLREIRPDLVYCSISGFGQTGPNAHLPGYDIMAQSGVPGGPINTLEELFSSDQIEAREMKVSVPHSAAASGRVDLIGNPVKFSKTPVQYRRGPPLCGEHNAEIIADLEAARKHK